MGRTKQEGTKNLLHVIEQPRFQAVCLTNGQVSRRFLVSTASYNKIVKGFEARGWYPENGGQQP